MVAKLRYLHLERIKPSTFWTLTQVLSPDLQWLKPLGYWGLVGDIWSFIKQEVDSSVKIIWVNVYEKLALASIKERQKLNIPVVDYVSLKSKAKPRQSKINKTHNSGCLLRALWKLDHLGPLWVNRSTNDFITSRGSSRWCKVNQVPGRFLDKQNIIQVFLGL